MNGSVFVGTSGWNYKHWKGPFYPEDIPDARLLEFYSTKLGTVEINNTFYRLPAEKSVLRWREAVPPEFVFSVKASRFITHVKRLKDTGDSLRLFLGRAALLSEKLGPVLFQLPPGLKRDMGRLEEFLDNMPGGYRYAFEFRNPDWLIPEVFKLLEKRGAAFCIYDLAGRHTPSEVTADFAYLRFHGPSGLAYAGKYGEDFHAEWSERISAWASAGLDVYCYFDNDMAGYAARDALRLNELVMERARYLKAS